MTEIRLLIVPYEVGAPRMGVGRGPERLLETGAEEALASAGAEVEVEVLELEEHERDRSGASEAGAAFELIGLVASRVRQARDEGAFPVLLSGSCFAGIGVVAGISESSPGVVWFDAHGDFNTPDSTVDGYVDGMGVAILTGAAWPAMVDGTGATTVPESAVLLAGAHDFDDLEERRLDASDTGLYVHVDLDVLESDEARVTIYSVPGGLSAAQLESQLRALLDSDPVRGFSLTAYDPEVDEGERVPPIAIRLLQAVAERIARER